MRKVVLTLFIIFMICFLALEIFTVVELMSNKQDPLVWIEDIY